MVLLERYLPAHADIVQYATVLGIVFAERSPCSSVVLASETSPASPAFRTSMDSLDFPDIWVKADTPGLDEYIEKVLKLVEDLYAHEYNLASAKGKPTRPVLSNGMTPLLCYHLTKVISRHTRGPISPYCPSPQVINQLLIRSTTTCSTMVLHCCNSRRSLLPEPIRP